MAVRRIQCREHQGGIFTIQVKRGRQPVRCKPEYPCDKADQPQPKTLLVKPPTRFEGACPECGGKGGHTATCSHSGRVAAPERATEVRTSPNASLPMAKAAKERLEAVGWTCQGRAWIDAGEGYASVTASRGEETLLMEWCETKVIRQDYSMNSPNPDRNGIPPHKLNFEPEEVTDSELARLVTGMKVTWWNSLAGSAETAIVGNKVNIEHIYVGGGDTDNSKRIVKFIDHSGGGFRAFHAGALLKVG